MNLFANSADSAHGVRQAWVLFEVVVVLLALFVFMIAVMAMRRYIARRRPAARRDPSNLPDPWEESARRVKPFDSTDQS